METTINYSEKIPNNVNLVEDRALNARSNGGSPSS